MTIVLDFDHTLFDTESFKRYLMRGNAFKYISGFTPGELDQFVYPDVEPFLSKYKDTTLVLFTAGIKMLQKRRIYSCSIISHFDSVLFSNWHLKGPVLQGSVEGFSQPIIFVDNHPRHIKSVAVACPTVRVVRMKRKRAPYSHIAQGDHQSVSSMTELQQAIEAFG